MNEPTPTDPPAPGTDSTPAPASRHHRGLRAVAIGVVVALVAVVGWRVYAAIVEPDEPSAFYTPPEDIPTSPGEIIRSEEVDPPVDGARAWRVLYASTDPSGTPIAVSGVIVAPDGTAPADGWPVIAWAHGTTGVASRCAPSLESHAGISLVPDYDKLLQSGTVIAITDYPGLGTPGPHPYLVGESEGRAVLDSIRAARQQVDGTNDRAAIFGHSQGGHATVFADQIAATYAPDVDVTGVAAMAPPTDLATLVLADDHEQLGIVLTALAIDAWSKFYPDARIADIVHEPARTLVADMSTRCIENTEQALTELPDVVGLQADFLSTDPTVATGWREHFAQNSPGDLPTDVPVLVAQGLADDLVRPRVTEAYVGQQCARGVPIELDTYAGVSHFGVRYDSADRVTDWLLARVAGDPAPTGCSTRPETAPGSDGGGGDGGEHAVATFEVAGGETYKIELVTPERIEHVRALMDGSEDGRIPNGVVVRDSPSVNEPWSWHIDPETLEFADMTTEVCDGLPSDVEDGLITSDRYCPWQTTVIALDE